MANIFGKLTELLEDYRTPRDIQELASKHRNVYQIAESMDMIPTSQLISDESYSNLLHKYKNQALLGLAGIVASFPIILADTYLEFNSKEMLSYLQNSGISGLAAEKIIEGARVMLVPAGYALLIGGAIHAVRSTSLIVDAGDYRSSMMKALNLPSGSNEVN